MNASLPVGGLIELTINWPLLLNGVRPLKLVLRGQIVRSDGNVVCRPGLESAIPKLLATGPLEVKLAGIQPKESASHPRQWVEGGAR
jgi:hypothetical protein